MKACLLQCAVEAGELLLRRRGNVGQVTRKESLSSVVTDTDLDSERLITVLIQRQFPKHNILSEESGFCNNGSQFTWVVDPLDGTGNFAAGLPWFAVSVALLKGRRPVLAAMHVPAMRLMLFSEVGKGVLMNGSPTGRHGLQKLGDSLCAFGVDADPHPNATFQ